MLASNGIFLPTSSAKKIVTDLQYCNVTDEKLTVCDKTVSTQSELIDTKLKIIEGLNNDKITLTEYSEGYKKLLINTNETLTECIENAPSRMTWFGAGVVSAVVLFLVTSLTTK